MHQFVKDPATARVGEEILPFEVGFLPDFFQRKAEVELHDSPERRAQAIRQIREMARNEKHCKHFDFDEEFLLQFVRPRKYNVARAFSQLKAFVNLRRKHPEMFTNFRYDVLVTAMSKQIITMLPRRCQDGCAILLVELDHWDPKEFPVEEVKRVIVILLLQSMRDPMTQVNGFKVILDVKSNPIRHLRHATPQNLYLIYHGTQECVSGRYKEVHIVNDSVTFKTAWLFLKPFLPDKLKKRIHFHNSSDSLMSFFPRSVLPVQYGGELEDYDMSDWLRRVTSPEQLSKMGGIPRQP